MQAAQITKIRSTGEFTEVDWALGDFIVAGSLLVGTGLIAQVARRKIQAKRLRTAFVMATLVVVVLVWAELAVGVFGTPFAGS